MNVVFLLLCMVYRGYGSTHHRIEAIIKDWFRRMGYQIQLDRGTHGLVKKLIMCSTRTAPRICRLQK
ncbi:hypothetical protein L6164_024998 [Bauhinia variegata]|uniref:Uncharacterized protein n=1 Tax=Bauhinia variegata TaxID=167791 RepID=A0ACB9LZ86_BAUVA|nr:hypothetical protein L6164_024998 [Bauhinia variegata]